MLMFGSNMALSDYSSAGIVVAFFTFGHGFDDFFKMVKFSFKFMGVILFVRSNVLVTAFVSKYAICVVVFANIWVSL